jgi:hypothetical protein
MSEPVLTFTRDGFAHVEGVRRPKRASFSALDKWRDCPGRWIGEKKFPKPLGWANPMTLGGIVHAALELAMLAPDAEPDWERLCLDGIGVERERVRRRGWGGPVLPEDVAMPDGVIPADADWAHEAAKKLKGFRLSDALGRPLRPAAREQELEAELWGSIPMFGSVDYRDADGSVVDWKTGKVPRFKDGAERHADQLRTYKALLEARGIVEVSHARDVYVEHSQWVEADLSKDAMAHTGATFKRAWDGIVQATGRDGDGMYRLNPGPRCGWCPLAGACPLAQLRGAKSLAAAADSVQGDDPRIAYEDAAARPIARGSDDGQPETKAGDDGFRPTHPREKTNDKENDMASTDDLLSMLLDASAAPAPDRKPRKSAAAAAADNAKRNPDPWESEAGRDAMATWGIRPEAPAPAQESAPAFVEAAEFAPKRQVRSPRHEERRGEDPWVTVDGKDVPRAQPESAPASEKSDPWSAPAAPRDDWTRAEERAKEAPGAEPKPAPAAPRETPGAEPKPAPAPAFKLSQGRPYDPTDNGKGYINTAGYGFAHLLSTYAKAALMAGAKSEDTGVIAAALLRAQWVAGRAAFGAAVPDVPGLMDGRPERHALFMWLDASLCRDADRALRAMMDDDPNLKPEAALGADETVRRINLSARRAGEALGAAMASLR